MNIVNKLTVAHLSKNKGRSIVTTLGICVSVAMITAVFVAVSSFMNLFGEISLISDGNYHIDFDDVAQTQVKELDSDSRISKTGIYMDNSVMYVKLTDVKATRVTTSQVFVGDENCLNMKTTGEYDGTLPKNEKEVAVEESFLKRNNLNLKVGDKINFTDCVLDFDAHPKADFYYDALTPQKGETEYTITAILHDNPATKFIYVMRGMSSSEKSADQVNVLALLNKVNYKSLDEVKDIASQYKIENYSVNSDYFQSHFAVDEDGYFAKSIIPLAAIILAIIMVASVVLIYNAFGMSFNERVRYLGMLASVGATKKQKKQSIYYEGFILGAIGIPIGIVAGIAGIGVTLKVLGGKIISTGMIQGVTENTMKMKVVISPLSIVGIVILSIITIFISALIPSKKASKITPIDAIRQRQDIKLKAKKLKSPKLIRKIFGYEGELAYKNLKRNGAKSKIITVSIALSLILFLCCNYFCSVLVGVNSYDSSIPYQVTAGIEYKQKDKLENEIKNIESVDRYYTVNNRVYWVTKDQPSLGDDIVNPDYYTSSFKKLYNEKGRNTYVNIIDDDAFNTLCKNNGLDSNAFYGDTVKCVLLNNMSRTKNGPKVFNDSIIGKTIKENTSETGNEHGVEATIGGFVSYDSDNYVCNLAPKDTVAFYIPLSQYINITNKDADLSEVSWLVGIETKDHKDVADKINDFFDTQSLNRAICSDNEDALQVMNTLNFIIQVFVYGFIVLITLITIANIINTITTNISSRRKEFAMLKSVGTTPKGFKKMICLESAFYGLKAVVVAIPVSLIINLGINKTAANSAIPFTVDWITLLIAVAVVFVIIGFSMLYAVSKLKNDSIIETLKEEIN